MDRLNYQQTSKFILVSSLVTSILVGIFVIGTQNYSLYIAGLHLLLPMLIIPVIILSGAVDISRIYTIRSSSAAQLSNQFRNSSKMLMIVFNLLFALSVIVLATHQKRPFAYYFIITLLSLIVILEILWDSDGSSRLLILAQSIILALNIVWGISLNYYYYYSNTDIFPHVYNIAVILQSGHTGPIPGIYTSFPLWHIFVSVEAMLMGGHISPRLIMYIISGIISVVFILLVYILTISFADISSALFAAIFTVISTSFIHNVSYSIPRTAASVLFLIPIYAFYVRLNGFRMSLLLYVVLSTIVLYHPATFPFALLGFLIILTISIYYDNRLNKYELYPWIAASIFALTHWLQNSISLLSVLARRSFDSTTQLSARSLTLESPLYLGLTRTKYLILFSFVLFGSITILNDKRVSNRLKQLSIAGLAFSLLVYPGPLSIVSGFLNQLEVDRFSLYLFPLVSIVLGTGFARIIMERDFIGKVGLIILITPAIILTVGTVPTATDNPLLPDESDRGYFTQPEISSITTFVDLVPGTVSTDHITRKYIESTRNRGKSHVLELPIRHYTGQPILVRNVALEESSFVFYDKGRLVKYNTSDEFKRTLIMKHKIFSSGSYSGYS